MNNKRLLILGVTASGKGQLAFELAESLGAEIISIDSMKVYRRMDIGTAKPPKQAREKIKHHLIDVVEPSQSFSVGAFLDLAYDATEQIKAHNKSIIAVGGTALYVKALLYGLFEGAGTDEQIRGQLRIREKTEGLEKLYRELAKIDKTAAERIHPNDSKRIIRALEVYELTGKPISSFQQQWSRQENIRNTQYAIHNTGYDWTVIGLRRGRSEESRRINARVKKMIAIGLVDEVKSLLAEDKPLSKQARCAIGYAEIIDYLNGKTTLEDTIELIKKNTRHLAKHQRTWFRSFKNVHWLDAKPDERPEQILTQTRTLLNDIQ